MKTALISADEPGQVPQIHLDTIRSIGMELVCRNCTTREELIELAADADILWMFGVCKPLTAEVLDQLPKCRAIFRSGSGVDALPWQRATEKGIAICNSPESIAEAVAEHAAALLLALAKKSSCTAAPFLPAAGWRPAKRQHPVISVDVLSV